MDLNFFANLQDCLEQETNRKDVRGEKHVLLLDFDAISLMRKLQEIRNTVKELDRACRKQNATLNQVHADPTGPGKRLVSLPAPLSY